MWSSILSLHNSSVTTIQSSPLYSQALYFYSDCLARISLSYSLYPNFFESVESHHYPSCLQQLKTAVISIPPDKKPPTHHFYPYHREIGALLNLIATASSTVFTARYSLTSLLTSLQLENISSLLSSNSLKATLESYNQTETHLLDAIALQNSFHYIEPEGFYLSVTECYLPFLQEARVFLVFLKELLRLFLSSSKSSPLDSLDPLILHLSEATRVDRIERLAVEEKRRRFPLRDSIWHQRSMIKIREMIKREMKIQAWDQAELSKADRFEVIIKWFAEGSQKFWNFRPNLSSSNAKLSITGACCELLYC